MNDTVFEYEEVVMRPQREVELLLHLIYALFCDGQKPVVPSLVVKHLYQ